jgi:hypothetical protein
MQVHCICASAEQGFAALRSTNAAPLIRTAHQ